MKRIILLLFVCGGIALNLKSQAPAAFSYQAVLSNGQGKILSNENVDVSVSIIDNNGTAVYQERFVRLTNNTGLLSLQIGKGDQILIGNLANVDWSNGNHFLRVSVRMSDNSTINLGDMQILSVPYALYAQKAKAPNLTLNGNQLGIEGSGTTITLPSGGSDSGLWSQNATDGVYTGNTVSFKSGSLNYFQAQNISSKSGGHLGLFNNGYQTLDLGGGQLTTYNNAGLMKVGVSSPADALDNGGIWMYGSGMPDAKATILAQKITNGSKGTFLIRGGDNHLKAVISSNEDNSNAGYLDLYGSSEIETAYVGSPLSLPGFGSVLLNDNIGNQRVALFTNKRSDGSSGQLSLTGTDNDIKVSLGIDNVNAGTINLYGANGNSNVAIGAVSTYPNTGGIWTYDSNGNKMAALTCLNGYPSNPYFALWYNNNTQGGFYVDTDGKSVLSVDRLIVAGTLRSASSGLKPEYTLRSSTTEDATCYTSQNGNEITLRGTASLQNGTAIIQLPQEVSGQIDSKTMTVQVTPLSADSKGVAVTDKQMESFKVQELMSGNGNYAFDWTLTARVIATLRSASQQRIEMPEAAMPASNAKVERVLNKTVIKGNIEPDNAK